MKTDRIRAKSAHPRKVRGYLKTTLNAAAIESNVLTPATATLRVFRMRNDADGTQTWIDSGARISVTNLSTSMTAAIDVLVFAEWDENDKAWYVYGVDCSAVGLTFED